MILFDPFPRFVILGADYLLMSYRVEYLLFIEILCLFFLPFVTENSCDSLFFDMFHFLYYILYLTILYYILINYIHKRG